MTFHAFGLRIVRQWSEELGFGLGSADRLRRWRGPCPATGSGSAGWASPWTAVRSRLGGRRHAASARRRPGRPRTEPLRLVVREYEDLLRRRSAIDYPAMLALPLRLFGERPVALRLCQDAYRHVLVDEFQDVCGAQYELLATACRAAPQSGRGRRSSAGALRLAWRRRPLPAPTAAGLPWDPAAVPRSELPLDGADRRAGEPPRRTPRLVPSVLDRQSTGRASRPVRRRRRTAIEAAYVAAEIARLEAGRQIEQSRRSRRPLPDESPGQRADRRASRTSPAVSGARRRRSPRSAGGEGRDRVSTAVVTPRRTQRHSHGSSTFRPVAWVAWPNHCEISPVRPISFRRGHSVMGRPLLRLPSPSSV